MLKVVVDKMTSVIPFHTHCSFGSWLVLVQVLREEDAREE